MLKTELIPLCSSHTLLKSKLFFPGITWFLRPTHMGTKNLYENGPNPFFLFGTKNMVRVKLMATVLFRHGFDT